MLNKILNYFGLTILPEKQVKYYINSIKEVTNENLNSLNLINKQDVTIKDNITKLNEYKTFIQKLQTNIDSLNNKVKALTFKHETIKNKLLEKSNTICKLRVTINNNKTSINLRDKKYEELLTKYNTLKQFNKKILGEKARENYCHKK